MIINFHSNVQPLIQLIVVASMAEEVHNPSSDVPRAIVWSIPIGFFSGVFFLVPIVFTLPDIATLLSGMSSQQYPKNLVNNSF